MIRDEVLQFSRPLLLSFHAEKTDGVRRAQKASKGVAGCWLSALCHCFWVGNFKYADVQSYLGWWPQGTSIFGGMGWNLGVVVAWHHNPKLHWDDLHASRCRRRESKGQRQGLQLLQNLFGVVVSDGCWWQVACGKWHVFFNLATVPLSWRPEDLLFFIGGFTQNCLN